MPRCLNILLRYTDSACATNSLDIARRLRKLFILILGGPVQAAKTSGQAMTNLVKNELPRGEKLLTMDPLS